MTLARRIVAALYVLIALVLGVVFFTQVNFPRFPHEYFDGEFHNQFGPIAICIELLVAGWYLAVNHPKTNFALALFGFTALLDPIFSALGLFDTNVPVYATVIFLICALPALWMAFTNTFGLGRISWLSAVGSFGLGVIVELFFNYL